MGQSRKVLSLDGEWEFAYCKENPKGDGDLPKEQAYEAKMPVPGYWDDYEERLNATSFWARGKAVNPDFQPLTMPIGINPPDMSLPYLTGCGWYRRFFVAGKDWAEKSVTLKIGGVTMEAWVWLNGTFLGHHEAHLVPYGCDLSEHILPGQKNELVIAVSNTRKDRIGCSIRGNKGKSGGIHHSVTLEVTGKVHVTDCFVYPDPNLEELNWQVTLAGTQAVRMQDTPLTIPWEIYDREKAQSVCHGT